MTPDNWSSADHYERFMGRWSRVLASEVIAWMNPPPGLRWLDVGCGTGAASEAVLDRASPLSLICADPSAEYVAALNDRIGGARVRVLVAGADDLPVPSSSVDVAVCGLVLNFVPEPASAMREMTRVLVPGGSATAYVWDYARGMQMLRLFWDAATLEDPAAVEHDEGRRFPICRPDALEACFTSAGLRDVTVTSIDVATTFSDFDDYWTPFMSGQGPAPGYCSGLSTAATHRLRDRLRSLVPTRPDGSLHLSARAWVARGTAA